MRASSRGLAYAGLSAGVLLAFVATAQPWWSTPAGGAEVTLTGTEATARLSLALAAVTGAGVLLSLALRSRGRRVMGALLVAAGLGIVLTGLLRTPPDPAALDPSVLGPAATAPFGEELVLAPTAWPYVYAAAGLLVAVAAAAMTLRAAGWQQGADRFRRDQPRRPALATGEDRDDPAALWRTLDAGMDPTESDRPAEESPGSPTTPVG